MIFKWETNKERLLRFMKISPQKKLERLSQINKFLIKFSSKKINKIRHKVREQN